MNKDAEGRWKVGRSYIKLKMRVLSLTGGIALGLLVLRTRIEEEKLIERFGEDYKEYMKRTGRFLPRLFQT